MNFLPPTGSDRLQQSQTRSLRAMLHFAAACIIAIGAQYDPASAQQPPVTTTTEANGIEDSNPAPQYGTTIVIALDGSDPQDPGAELIAMIQQLPARGSLEQLDGTPIDSAPAVVTDPARQVVVQVPINGSGLPYAAFFYTLTNPDDNRRSAWCKVDVNITPTPDRPVMFALTPPQSQQEEQASYVRFGGTDPDNDQLFFIPSDLPDPVFGTLYQVENDNLTPGEPITEAGTVLSNPRGWMIFLPDPNYYGQFQVPFFAIDGPLDESPLFSIPLFQSFTVNNVNDAPTANPHTHSAPNNLPAMTVTLDIVDPDGGPGVTGAITRLPTNGDLYRDGTLSEANRVTAADPYFSGIILAYQPHVPGAFGDPFDTFSYIASDGVVATAEVTDTIVIQPVGGFPLPDPVDEYAVASDDPAGLDFSLQPVLIDHPLTDLFVTILSLPEHGALILNPPVTSFPLELTFAPIGLPPPPAAQAGVWPFTYVPDPGFDSIDPITGDLTPDTFTYQVETSNFENPETFTVSFFVHEETEDADGDGTVDACPADPNKTTPGDCGCGVTETGDSDGDGVPDCLDGCPDNPNKTDPGVCGCEVDDQFAPECVPLGDSDGDGVADVDDGCPFDPNKIDPGACGCGVIDADLDGDGVPFCLDGCPGNPDMTEPGAAGCDNDTDGDGVPDGTDACPFDPDKSDTQGLCGCGVADVDTDGDGEVDCFDGCPNDPNKTDPGILGCGVPDTDTDGDLVLDAFDDCPNDPNKFEPGDCGCGTIESADSDGDGISDCVDACPNRRPGDINGDGSVDIDDAGPLATILLDPAAATPDDYCAADSNGDTAVNGLDVQGFIAHLLGA